MYGWMNVHVCVCVHVCVWTGHALGSPNRYVLVSYMFVYKVELFMNLKSSLMFVDFVCGPCGLNTSLLFVVVS